ncbi:MAG: hypothetical protein IJ523_09540 [Succinivibrionaceae bacterium]|nr:hypothetical protein [Succinivibrionaceae bacterium]
MRIKKIVEVKEMMDDNLVAAKLEDGSIRYESMKAFVLGEGHARSENKAIWDETIGGITNYLRSSDLIKTPDGMNIDTVSVELMTEYDVIFRLTAATPDGKKRQETRVMMPLRDFNQLLEEATAA